MLELGTGQPAEDTADLVKDSDEANFMADVVEMSQQVPVVARHWARSLRKP